MDLELKKSTIRWIPMGTKLLRIPHLLIQVAVMMGNLIQRTKEKSYQYGCAFYQKPILYVAATKHALALLSLSSVVPYVMCLDLQLCSLALRLFLVFNEGENWLYCIVLSVAVDVID